MKLSSYPTDPEGVRANAVSQHRATRPADRALFHGLDLSAGIAFASLAAFDESVECLRRRDFAGFDAAMRVFHKISKEGREGQLNKRLPSDQ